MGANCLHSLSLSFLICKELGQTIFMVPFSSDALSLEEEEEGDIKRTSEMYQEPQVRTAAFPEFSLQLYTRYDPIL